MPRVIPGGGPDTTSQFLLQITHGNQALARLYATLLAKYEDRLEQQAFQREMQGTREAAADRRATTANERWYDQERFRHDLRNPPGAPAGPNLLGPGAAGSPAPATPAAAPPPRAAEAPIERPSVYTLDKNPYSGSGAGTSAPVAPAPQSSNTTGVSPKVAALLNSGAADAQASGAGHTEFSAQSRRPPPTVSEPPKPFRRESTPPTQLPSQPRVGPRTQPKPQAQYLDVDQRWLDLMHTEEDKHKLPRGSLMTLYGLENGGGRQFGTNKSGSATGIFQFHRDLRAQYKLSDEDTRDPAKMIPAAAANLRRNADILERDYKIKLPTTPETMPMWATLHQWGSGAGPRIVAAYVQNPEAPMTSIMGTHKDAQGNVIPNYNVLSTNNINPSSTVKQAIQANKAPFWLNGYIQQFPEHANQPVGSYKPVTITPPAEDPNVPRPPASVSLSGMGSNPRLIRAIQGGAQMALPQGYTIRQTSGHRPGDTGYHGRAEAGDFQIYTPEGRPLSNRGEDTTGLYTRVARGVKSWILENDPQFRVNWGGAHSTAKRGGLVSDIMHFDTGPDRGNLRPDLRMSRLAPLGRDERNAPTQVAQQPQQPQPVRVAGPLPPRETEPTRPYVTSAISRIPTSGEVGATFAARDKAPAAATEAAPPLNIPPISTPIKAGVGTSAARSDPYYNLQNDIGEGIPTLDTRNVPMPPERPITESGDLGGVGTPADAPLPGLDEQLDVQTNAPQVPLPPLKPPEPEFTPAERIPMSGAPGELTSPSEYGAYGTTPPDSVQDAMADAFRQRTEPGYKTADFNVIPQVAVGDLPPQGEISTTAKQPLPAEFDAVTPAQRTPPPADFTLSPQLDVPTTVARAPLPPGFKVPLPTLGGDASAAASVSTNQMPRDLQQPLPARLPPPLPPEVSSGNAPTLRSIIDAIYSGNIPKLSTATDPNAVNVRTPPPEIPEQQLAETLAIPADKLQAVGEWLKQNFGPGGQPDNQKVFNEAMQQYVRSGVNAVSDWWNRSSAPTAKPTTQSGPPAPHVAAQPAPRTMPDGRPYFPPPEPLVVPPRPGAGPANTVLSGGGNTPLPAPPGQYNPMTGRIDVPAPDTLQDGTKKFYEPGEQPVE